MKSQNDNGSHLSYKAENSKGEHQNTVQMDQHSVQGVTAMQKTNIRASIPGRDETEVDDLSRTSLHNLEP